MATKTGSFTGQKAQFLNMKLDNVKIRSTRIESKKAYKRKPKHRNDW